MFVSLLLIVVSDLRADSQWGVEHVSAICRVLWIPLQIKEKKSYI